MKEERYKEVGGYGRSKKRTELKELYGDKRKCGRVSEGKNHRRKRPRKKETNGLREERKSK